MVTKKNAVKYYNKFIQNTRTASGLSLKDIKIKQMSILDLAIGDICFDNRYHLSLKDIVLNNKTNKSKNTLIQIIQKWFIQLFVFLNLTIQTKKIADKNIEIIFFVNAPIHVKTIAPILKKTNRKYIVIVSDYLVNSKSCHHILKKNKINYINIYNYHSLKKELKVLIISKKLKRIWKKFRKNIDSKKDHTSKSAPLTRAAPILDYMFVHRQRAREIVRHAFIIDSILKNICPKLVVTLDDFWALPRIFIKLCQQRKIKSLVIQHGKFSDESISCSGKANKYAVYSISEKENFQKKGYSENVKIVGSTRLNNTRNEKKI